jgi:hypothetical protein
MNENDKPEITSNRQIETEEAVSYYVKERESQISNLKGVSWREKTEQ